MTKNLVSITPFFIVKDLQASLAFIASGSVFSSTSKAPKVTCTTPCESGWHRIIRLEHYARCAASTVRVGSAPVHDTSAVGP